MPNASTSTGRFLRRSSVPTVGDERPADQRGDRRIGGGVGNRDRAASGIVTTCGPGKRSVISAGGRLGAGVNGCTALDGASQHVAGLMHRTGRPASGGAGTSSRRRRPPAARGTVARRSWCRGRHRGRPSYRSSRGRSAIAHNRCASSAGRGKRRLPDGGRVRNETMYSMSSRSSTADQRVADRRDRVPDAGTWPGKWADIESDAQRVHGQAEASRYRQKVPSRRRLPCPALWPQPARPFEGLPACPVHSSPVSPGKMVSTSPSSSMPRTTKCSAWSRVRTTRRMTQMRDEFPYVEPVPGDLADLPSLVKALEYDAARRGLQPRRHLVRRVELQPGRAHRQHHRARCAAHARSDPHGRWRREQPDPLLPGEQQRDVRQGPRDAADRAHAVSSALAVRLRQGVRSRHRRQLPRELRPVRVQRHPVQPRRPAPRSRVRHPQGHQRGRPDQARSADTRSCSATSTPSATGAMPATT